jgi:hypothetical protein
MTRDEVREWLAEFLLEMVREDPYPSPTHLDLIEKSIPCYMIPEYIEVLQEKAEQDLYPSIPLLRRILRLTACLPRQDDPARQAETQHTAEEAPR